MPPTNLLSSLQKTIERKLSKQPTKWALIVSIPYWVGWIPLASAVYASIAKNPQSVPPSWCGLDPISAHMFVPNCFLVAFKTELWTDVKTESYPRIFGTYPIVEATTQWLLLECIVCKYRGSVGMRLCYWKDDSWLKSCEIRDQHFQNLVC